MVNENYIGRMDRLIQIKKKIETRDSTGAPVRVDQLIAEVWAERKSATSDKDVDEKVVALNVFEYYFHWQQDIAAEIYQELYVTDDGDEFEVYGAEELGREDRIRFKCERRE